MLSNRHSLQNVGKIWRRQKIYNCMITVRSDCENPSQINTSIKLWQSPSITALRASIAVIPEDADISCLAALNAVLLFFFWTGKVCGEFGPRVGSSHLSVAPWGTVTSSGRTTVPTAPCAADSHTVQPTHRGLCQEQLLWGVQVSFLSHNGISPLFLF